MEKIKCTCCGAPLRKSEFVYNEYVCEYCGNKFKIDNNIPIKIETFQNPVQTLYSKMEIEDEFLKDAGEATVAEIAMRNLTRNLADSLAPFMRIESTYDPARMTHTMTARIRLVEDNYKF